MNKLVDRMPRKLVAGLAVAAALGGSLLVASPALAATTATVKNTPYGCTEADWTGTTKAATNGVTGRTFRNSITCAWLPNADSGVNVRIGSTSTGAQFDGPDTSRTLYGSTSGSTTHYAGSRDANTKTFSTSR